eukprot:gnl/TRDRNA2_/TRDRNA2_165090_c0_seq1.p1 gnl/TRDRNA2_/TRDRNA2_165090_c0~~gnl/TRDRNA2_/TRDRNA2_165090_c0_seq1.p1  ORF type:complete len:431 (-),score=54.42 gnl/TRDRNA2_/TRDRNA2_165090_c0_seq1:220-1512(-)
MILVTCDWVLLLQVGGGLVGMTLIGKSLRFMRFVRVVRLIRIFRLKRFVDEIHDRINTEGVATLMNIICSLIFILAMNHLVACGFFGISDWFEVKGWRERLDQNDRHGGQSKEYLYTTALHWSLTQFTPASMDVQPDNIFERIYAIVVMLFALVVFSSFVSGLTSAISRLRESKTDESRQQWRLRRYLHTSSVSTRLSLRIQRYVEYMEKRNRGHIHEEDVKLLNLLSEPLKQELHLELYARFFKDHPLFKRLDQEQKAMMLKMCSDTLLPMPLARGDVLFFTGEVATTMLVLDDGNLQYRRKAAKGSELVLPAQWIAEAILWVPWVHVGDMRSVVEAHLVKLDPKRFRDNVAKLPEEWVRVRNFADLVVNRLNELTRNELSDLTDDTLRPECIHLYRQRTASNLSRIFMQARWSEGPIRRLRRFNPWKF